MSTRLASKHSRRAVITYARVACSDRLWYRNIADHPPLANLVRVGLTHAASSTPPRYTTPGHLSSPATRVSSGTPWSRRGSRLPHSLPRSPPCILLSVRRTPAPHLARTMLRPPTRAPPRSGPVRARCRLYVRPPRCLPKTEQHARMEERKDRAGGRRARGRAGDGKPGSRGAGGGGSSEYRKELWRGELCATSSPWGVRERSPRAGVCSSFGGRLGLRAPAGEARRMQSAPRRASSCCVS